MVLGLFVFLFRARLIKPLRQVASRAPVWIPVGAACSAGIPWAPRQQVRIGSEPEPWLHVYRSSCQSNSCSKLRLEVPGWQPQNGSRVPEQKEDTRKPMCTGSIGTGGSLSDRSRRLVLEGWSKRRRSQKNVLATIRLQEPLTRCFHVFPWAVIYPIRMRREAVANHFLESPFFRRLTCC